MLRNTKDPRLGPKDHCSHRMLLCGIAVFVLGAGSLNQVVGQHYDALPMNDQFVLASTENWDLLSIDERNQITARNRAVSERRREAMELARRVLRGEAQRNDSFDQFVREVVLAGMAQTDEQSLSEMGKRRAEFLRQFLGAEFSGANRIYLIEQLVIPTMRQVAEGNYHPSARVNAAVLIGQLNNSEFDSATRRPPIPNLQSVRAILDLVENPGLPLYVKAAAFSGLQRVAQLHGSNAARLDAAELQRIVVISTAIAGGDADGQGAWDPEGNVWLRRRAVQVLGELRQTGPASEVVTLLNRVLGDDALDVWLRFDAVVALGQLNYASADVAQVGLTLKNVTAFLAGVLEHESQQIVADVEDLVALNLLLEGNYLGTKGAQLADRGSQFQTASGMTDSSGSGAGASDANEKTTFEMPVYYTNVLRRKCKTYVYFVQSALKNEAFGRFGTAEEKRLLADVKAILDRLLKDSDVGLKDLSRPDEPAVRSPIAGEPQIKKSTTTQMMELFESASLSLYALIGGKPTDAAETSTDGAAANQN
ncbi:MAG TPA: hypothetical protein PKD54_07015 [Pirellulaceae bacterium]|nr:hypothetical protein [Pirellulaceae bacterium]